MSNPWALNILTKTRPQSLPLCPQKKVRFNTRRSNLTSGAADWNHRGGRKRDTTYLISELNSQNIDIALNTHGPPLKTLERAVLANDVGRISVSEWLPCGYQSEQESARDQTALRHRRRCLSLSSLWRARLRRIMRMQGRLGRLGYLPRRPQTPCDIAAEDLENIVEGGRSQRILGREVFFCVWCRAADKRSES